MLISPHFDMNMIKQACYTLKFLLQFVGKEQSIAFKTNQ